MIVLHSFGKRFYVLFFYMFLCHISLFAPFGLNCDRSSRSEVFCKKAVIRNVAKLIGKHLCHILFFNKVSFLLKKRLWHRCFPVNFAKFLRIPFLTELLWYLLLLRIYSQRLWFFFKFENIIHELR